MHFDRQTLTHLPMLVLMVYFGSGVDLYLNTLLDIPPLYGQVAGLGYMVVWIAGIAATTNGRALAVPRATAALFLMLLVLCLFSAMSFIYSPQSEEVFDALVGRIKSAMFIVTFALVLIDPALRTKFAYAAAVIAVLGSVLSLFDFFTPTFSTVPGRGASFYLNSNETAMLLVAFAIIASSHLRVMGNYLLWVIVSFGVLVTFSRSGWLMLMIGLFGLSVLGKFGGGRIRFVLLGVVGLVIAGVFAAYLSGDLYIWLSRSTLAEFLDPNTLARLGSQGAAIDDYSSLERRDIFWFGLDKFLESPFIGWGVGYGYVWAESASTHNMPLALAVELGVAGPLLYFAFFGTAVAFVRGPAQLLTIVLIFGGASSHNQFEFIADALVIAFVVASTAENAYARAVKARSPGPAERSLTTGTRRLSHSG